MSLEKSHKKNQSLEDIEFTNDVCDFFSEKRAGHMSKWLYSSPLFAGDKACGADAWKHVIEQAKNGSDYYVFQNERSVIQSSVSKLQDIFSQKVRLIDLGPGSENAIRDKIMPFIQVNTRGIKEYVGVDVCPKTLEMAKNEVLSLSQSIEANVLERDFIQDNFHYGSHVSHEVAFIFGLTLCNMAIDPRVYDLPKQMLSSHFKRLQSHFNSSESYLIVTQDTNQNPVSLRNAYYKESYDFLITLLYRIQRDVPISSGYNPQDFCMEVDYFKDTQACSLSFVPQKDMSFSIDDRFFELKKGQKLYFHNAFKFDKETFLDAAKVAGLDCVFTEELPNNPCLLHVFKKIPSVF